MIKFYYDSDFDNEAPYYVIGNADNLLVVVNPACTDHLDPWVRETLINELIARGSRPAPPNNLVRLDEVREYRRLVSAGLESASQAVATDR